MGNEVKRGGMTGLSMLRAAAIAFSTYSAIPVPQVAWTEENRRLAMCFFPLVGAVIGLLLWGWLALADALQVGSFLRGAVAALIPLLVTGGIHMDGFMDTSDALASWQTKEKRLEIMKDSHVGAFAVMHCAGYLLVQAAIYGEAAKGAGPMLACVFVLSRAMSAWALTALRNARPKGMLDAFGRAAGRRMTLISGLVYASVCLGVLISCDIRLATMCIVAAAVCLFVYRGTAYRQFGGVTGDLAGWFLQVTELALSAVIIIGGRLI
ncbi:MAG: adenosylcobinamide-GDP ribazoletransferase [Clostridia bacterium]|nr:adenosylcobinamide-GDP ribazoletransferase [Clostridia bacterium]